MGKRMRSAEAFLERDRAHHRRDHHVRSRFEVTRVGHYAREVLPHESGAGKRYRITVGWNPHRSFFARLEDDS